MDPISAFALAVKAIAEMVTEIVKGQSPAQKEKMWEWYVKDVERWRKLFQLDAAENPAPKPPVPSKSHA